MHDFVDQPGDVARRLRVQHADVSRHAAAVQHRPEAVQRERPLRPDSPAAERSVRRLQRAAADRSPMPVVGRGLIVKYTHMLAF